MLAATCNVRAAAAAAGFSTEACYKQRVRRPAFAADWARALEQGYERLETMLIEMMLVETTMNEQVTGNARSAKGGSAKRRTGKPLPYAEIVKLLRMHGASVRGVGAQRYS